MARYDNHRDSNDKEYLFIDGGCLREALSKMSQALGITQPLSVLFPVFAEDASKVFYYDAVSAQERDEALADYERRVEIEHQQFDRIRALDRFHVSLGEVKGRKGNRRQKQVDVRLAVDMLTHTFRGNMQRATLFAGDDDFIPLVEALVREGMTVTVWHPPQASEGLLSAADNRQPLTLSNSRSFLSVDGVSPAFDFNNHMAGVSVPLPAHVSVQWENEGNFFAGKWDGVTLMLWRRTSSGWNHVACKAQTGTARSALGFITVAQGWKPGLEAAEALENDTART